MTTIGNPYGDAAGAAPNWGNLKDLANSAYTNAVTKLHSKNNDLLQQYGFQQNDNMDTAFADPLSNTNPVFDASSLLVNTANPYGQYQQMVAHEGQGIQGLLNNAAARGLGQYGLGAQGVEQAHTAADMEQGQFAQNVYNALSGDYGTAADTKSQTAQQLAGIDTQHGNYDQWNKTHLVSEGGLVPDTGPGSPGYKAPAVLTPAQKHLASVKANTDLSNTYTKFSGAKNPAQQTSILGNMRDGLKAYAKQYGKDDNYKKQLALYNAGAHRLGLKGSKWVI